jgi:hypothetical protein
VAHAPFKDAAKTSNVVMKQAITVLMSEWFLPKYSQIPNREESGKGLNWGNCLCEMVCS